MEDTNYNDIVFAEMLQPQVEATLGKLVPGQIIRMPRALALRWKALDLVKESNEQAYRGQQGVLRDNLQSGAARGKSSFEQYMALNDSKNQYWQEPPAVAAPVGPLDAINMARYGQTLPGGGMRQQPTYQELADEGLNEFDWARARAAADNAASTHMHSTEIMSTMGRPAAPAPPPLTGTQVANGPPSREPENPDDPDAPDDPDISEGKPKRGK